MGRISHNVLQGHPYAVDALYRADNSAEFAKGELFDAAVLDSARKGVTLEVPPGKAFARRRIRGVYTSGEVRAEFPFNEILPSWNIHLDERRQSYTIELRVADERGWSPWFYFGSAGNGAAFRTRSKNIHVPQWGRVKIDYLVLENPAERFQYRVILESAARPELLRASGAPLLKRFFAAYSNTVGDEFLWKERSASGPELPKDWSGVLDIPYRDQRNVPHSRIGHEICCPTCVAMVLDSHGISMPTLAVAGQAWCPERRIYGIWPRAAQAASRHGFEAWVQRFRTGADVKRLIAAGIPVIASIRVKEGELSNARYPKTAGHLILIRGFTPAGDYVVNDPYSPGPTGQEIVYSQKEMETVWFDRGGVGIVIRRPGSEMGQA